MDFVDLDKVLDQFEEEEKAADELVPGQETKPSGGNTSSKPAVEFQGPVGEKVRTTLGSYRTSSTDHSDHYHSHNGIPGVLPVHNTEQSVSLQEDTLQIKLKQDTIESYMSLQLNGSTFEQTNSGNLDEAIKLRSGEESEKRGLIASLPVGIQTDSLSPASEQELLFSALPRTDILVTGHGDTTKSANDSCSAVNESETINIFSSECFSYKQDSEMSTINGSVARHDSSRLDVGSQEHSGVCTVNESLGVGQNVITETVVMADSCSANRSPGADQQVEIPVTVEKERTCFPRVESQEGRKWDESEAGSIPCQQFQDGRTPGGMLEREAEENLHSKGLQLTDTMAFPPTDDLTVIGFREEMANMDSDAIEAYLNDLESSPDIDWNNTLSDCNVDVSESGHAHSTDQPDPNQCRLYNAEPSHAVVNESSPSGSNAQRELESYNLQESYLHGCPDDAAVALTSCGVIKVQEDQKLCSPDTNNSSLGGSDTEAECNHSSTMQPLDVAMDQSMQVEGNVKITAQDDELTVPYDATASLPAQDGELTAPRDTTVSRHTFSFPNTDCSINMSALVRGKLEIEGLLDEMLAARRMQGDCSVVRSDGEAIQAGSGDEVHRRKGRERRG
ncbi:hypothetical protein C0Q70_15914 [Pomacea canaliculata]|uniref:Uncharacterized protein n=1 Tax=Pomacea canaliculata TaxID=400727 RepID=A0A2T7NNA8_POMCA|nr:hypothetical protein C0Q70_15914 [Pomacea canaliculata]